MKYCVFRIAVCISKTEVGIHKRKQERKHALNQESKIQEKTIKKEEEES